MTDPIHKMEKRIQNVLALFGCTLGARDLDAEFQDYYHVLGPDGFCIDVHIYGDSFLDDIICGKGEEAIESLFASLNFKFEQLPRGHDFHIDVYGVDCEAYDEEYQP